jgi:hypothetical protein
LSALKICPVCSTEYPANERFCPRDGSALRTQGVANDLVGAVIAERYHVLKKLGEGGMGQVYLAEHVKMGRKSAVKVMNPGMVQNIDAISRFNREAANASRINHPNVAGIYDFGETADGLIYLAMEFVEGQPLTDIIKSHGALPPMRASEIARQTAEGLAVAHDMGIVHRDLKPDNIMIGKGRNGADLVKVVDFGIAKAAASDEQKVTKTGMVVGTPEYMSPEQLSGDPLDARSDIYSLALVTFNMLTGKLPFPGESMQETMIMRLTDDPQPLQAMRPEIAWPADLQVVMDKALARDANQRYRSAHDFAVDLVEAIDRMPASSITTMGTQVLAPPMTAADMEAAQTAATVQVQVPPTRVASRSGGGGAKSATPPAPSPAHTPTKSKTPLMAGVGAAVLIAAIGGAMVLKPWASKTAPDTANSTLPVSTPTSPDSVKPGLAAGAQSSPPASVPLNQSLVSVSDSLRVFDKYLELNDDSASARAILGRLSALNPKGDEEVVRAARIVYLAKLALDDAGAACIALKDVQDRAARTSLKAKIEADLKGCTQE